MQQKPDLPIEDTNPSFQQSAQEQWALLNPCYVRPDDNILHTVVNVYRETIPRYFAPLRFLTWLLKYGFTRVFRHHSPKST